MPWWGRLQEIGGNIPRESSRVKDVREQNMSRRAIKIFSILLVLPLLTGCAGEGEGTKTALPEAASTGVAPRTVVIFGPPGYMEMFSAFAPLIANAGLTYDFQVRTGASPEAGILGVLDGTFDLMILMRRPLPDEPLFFTELFRTPVVFFINPQMHIVDLTHEQVAAIFTGDITNWSEIGGPDQAIAVFVQQHDDAVTQTLCDVFLGGRPVTESARILPEEKAVFAVVDGIPGAIGYAGLAGKRFWEYTLNTKYLDAVALDSFQADDPDYPVMNSVGLAYLPDKQAMLQPLLDWATDFLETELSYTLMDQFGVRPGTASSIATQEGPE